MEWLINHPEVALALLPPPAIATQAPQPPVAAVTSEDDELALAIAMSLQGGSAAAESPSVAVDTAAAAEQSVSEEPQQEPPADEPAPVAAPAAAPMAYQAVARGRRPQRGGRGINMLGRHAAPLDMTLDAILGQPSSRTDSKELTAQSEALERLSKQYVLDSAQLLPGVIQLAASVCGRHARLLSLIVRSSSLAATSWFSSW